MLFIHESHGSHPHHKLFVADGQWLRFNVLALDMVDKDAEAAIRQHKPSASA